MCTSPAEPSVSVRVASDGYLHKILQARVYDVAHETALQHAPLLSTQLRSTVYLKREDTQPVFSFKIRGAYNKIASLSEEQRLRGIVACSAGNHAQGVAFSASRLGITNAIVMPNSTPRIKVDAVRKLGGNVILHGENYDDAQAEAMRLVQEKGYTLVHPFDDPYVIAGQGTVAMEILNKMNGKRLDAIFVCCGGGGLLAGVLSYVKRVRPDIEVYGVEAVDAAGMTASLSAGKRVALDDVGSFADGAAVRLVGRETFAIASCARDGVDGMITVSNDDICAAIKDGFNDTRCVMEPAGALAIAGMKKWVGQSGHSDKTYVAITSGANMDFDRLRFVSERADASEVLLSVCIPERTGAFRDMYAAIFPRNVTELSYRITQKAAKARTITTGDQEEAEARPQEAHIYISFQARSERDTSEVTSALETAGYAVSNLSENEMAKAHGRHLAGGRVNTACTQLDERLIRFEFPERSGALGKFLDSMGSTWNVSLFHYRNHGADIGRVLVGMTVPKRGEAEFEDFLTNLGYKHYDESHNPVYSQFML